jgi:ElaB/YqjD/DUF883 family membrane-anchored ribosome-binding protein
MANDAPEPDADAGINALRLDADRARDALEGTLHEIEARLDPQRVIRPVRQAVDSVAGAYRDNPVRFVAVAAGIVGAVAALVILVARSGDHPA